ncbi:PE family protein [Mycobacterium haemophilum]|uniref:PE domain-containing protein n=1 Tax=Mycobacterium haemophilum TaxID=29311 RepID=A0A0I9UM97_9MYCO|nr:PE family protein [Mycobacterium haemophilum]KLO30709.1 hypothetical protein ABH39_10055 [Mycobacterium haemophilum]KLO37752.1 hypothetical protein ABH38_07265 [Mycobacterium haemophilum]KLO43168.1 hypothetical protein ABH37_07820 [Mycobacterium haemophilum]KLO55574.1 hypothetical protein ABH36_06220 [Mycobacterium haemophilum]
MSFVFARLDELEAAAGQLQTISLSSAASNAAAYPVTTAVRPPARDETSALIARFFSNQAKQYHEYAAQAADSHQKLIESLRTGSFAYRDADSDIANEFGIF